MIRSAVKRPCTRLLFGTRKFSNLEHIFASKIAPQLQINQLPAACIHGVLNLNEQEGKQYTLYGNHALPLCVADYLYTHFPNLSAEQMQAILIQFCRRQNLVRVAQQLGFANFLQNEKTASLVLHIAKKLIVNRTRRVWKIFYNDA